MASTWSWLMAGLICAILSGVTEEVQAASAQALPNRVVILSLSKDLLPFVHDKPLRAE
jgi:hypothetical protein